MNKDKHIYSLQKCSCNKRYLLLLEQIFHFVTIATHYVLYLDLSDRSTQSIILLWNGRKIMHGFHLWIINHGNRQDVHGNFGGAAEIHISCRTTTGHASCKSGLFMKDCQEVLFGLLRGEWILLLLYTKHSRGLNNKSIPHFTNLYKNFRNVQFTIMYY